MLNSTIYRIENNIIGSQRTNSFEGDAKNQMMIVVKSEDLSPENRKTVSDILNAIKYNLEDSCLITLNSTSTTNLNNTIRQYDINRILCFGIAPKDVGLQLITNEYQLVEMDNLKLVFSHSIGDLNSDKKKKIALWKTIQGL